MKIVITSGGTREKIDPVRFIGNYSSGKMGAALVKAFKQHTDDITVISGPCDVDYKTDTIHVESAREMLEVAKQHLDADVFIAAAAVADKRPKAFSKAKLKKDKFTKIELVDNPDILKFVGTNKARPHIVVGFAAESENHIKNARGKLTKKSCDLVVVNDIKALGSDESEVWIVRKRVAIHIPKAKKTKVAHAIVAEIFRELLKHKQPLS